MNHYKHKIVQVDQLVPYAQNSRTHTDEQVDQIAASIEEWGFTNPVLIDEENGIIAGHGRVLAAVQLKIDKIPCIVMDGLSEAQKRAYVIADNRLALNAGWNDKLLAAELSKLEHDDFDLNLLGFDELEIAKLLGDEESEQTALGREKFSEELGEAHNYVVLYFDNDIDWLNAQTHFGLETVSSKRQNGKPWSKGIGRVIDGAKYLTELKRHD